MTPAHAESFVIICLDRRLTLPPVHTWRRELEHSLLQQRMQQDLDSGEGGVLGHEGLGHEGQPSEEELEMQEAANQEILRQQDATLAQVRS